MIGATVVFLVGSGLCGGSTSIKMLIGSRAVQGVGAGGINMLIDMIICDLVPMRERGNFIGLLFLFVSLGTTIGPFVGGVLTDRVTWRWVSYNSSSSRQLITVLTSFSQGLLHQPSFWGRRPVAPHFVPAGQVEARAFCLGTTQTRRHRREYNLNRLDVLHSLGLDVWRYAI